MLSPHLERKSGPWASLIGSPEEAFIYVFGCAQLCLFLLHSPFFFEQDTRFPQQLGLQSPGQLQISSAVGGLGGWELGGDVEGGDDGKWRGRREREREEAEGGRKGEEGKGGHEGRRGGKSLRRGERRRGVIERQESD